MNQKEHKEDFLAYAFAESERMKWMGKQSLGKNYKCAAKRLQDFLELQGLEDLPIEKMNQKTIQQFEGWLHQQGISKNASSAYLRSLHAIYMRIEGDATTLKDPFTGTYRGVAKTRKRALTEEDVRQIAAFDIVRALRKEYLMAGKKTNSKRFLQKVQKLTFARDMFIFSFCARGMTYVDMAFLRKSDVRQGVISYHRRKTGQSLQVKIEPDMQHIMDRYPSATTYQFPIIHDCRNAHQTYTSYLSAISYYNKALTELGELLGMKLSSYVVRHSWATIANERVSTAFVSQSLGHESIRTTEIYLKTLTTSSIDQANHTLLLQLLHPR